MKRKTWKATGRFVSTWEPPNDGPEFEGGIVETTIDVPVGRDEAWKYIGAYLRRRRTSAGLSAREVAQRTAPEGGRPAFSTQFVGMVERGERRPSIEHLTAMFDAIGLDTQITADQRDLVITNVKEDEYGRKSKQVLRIVFQQTPAEARVGSREWMNSLSDDETRMLGVVVRTLSNDGEKLLEVYRHLGFDEDYNTWIAWQDDQDPPWK